MFFNKFPHRANFAYATGFEAATRQFKAGNRTFSASFENCGAGVYRICIDHSDWGKNRSLIELTPPHQPTGMNILDVDLGFGLAAEGGRPLLCTVPERAFGVC